MRSKLRIVTYDCIRDEIKTVNIDFKTVVVMRKNKL